jgi:uncharacterized protein YccT (UPF0319 family)
LIPVAVGEGLPLREQSLIAIVCNELQVLQRDLAQGNEAGAKASFSLITRLCNQASSTSSSVSEAGALRVSRFFQDAEQALQSWPVLRAG